MLMLSMEDMHFILVFQLFYFQSILNYLVHIADAMVSNVCLYVCYMSIKILKCPFCKLSFRWGSDICLSRTNTVHRTYKHNYNSVYSDFQVGHLMISDS
jgi:hypothetical protein